ncbi:hypothetical protein GCM10011531_03020 [Aquaticitalea lipolytica]|uniref:DUF4252 domain-containing protein n=1 Tax=Aquaticitalea lipolytica TaxID=1247562 RepID=A0A8J2XF27_9FLAO|nr:DUF4252 domain-containing protein [Aquaticitalea lipolytica]GFZ77119.1 hypothetical protein GCM10011531_03020 [Aquaticitalea lipolytica]
MKKIIIVLAIIITPIFSFGQSVFDKFEDDASVSSFIMNQKMFNMIATIDVNMDDPEDQAFVDMAKKITGLKVFTTGNEKTASEMNATVEKYLKSSSLEELMRMKDGNQTIKFYVKQGKDENHVKELLMIINGLKELTKDSDMTINGKKRDFETVLLSLTGDIDLRQISKMTQKMNVPGGQQLEKAGKAKKQ